LLFKPKQSPNSKWGRALRRSVPVLMYHHVSPNPGLVTVAPEIFEAQMRYLRDAGYATLCASEFQDFIRGNLIPPGKAVLITFDDGFLDNYVYAFPVLQQYGLRALIFTVTGWIGDGAPRACAGDTIPSKLPATPSHKQCKAAVREGHPDDVMLRWSEIRRMEANGTIEIHSHTHSHVRWDQEVKGPQERALSVSRDLEISQQTLQRQLGRTSRHLCWPWGYFEPSYQEAAAEAGFEVQYTTCKGPNVTGSDARAIQRIVVKDRAGRWFPSRLWIYRHAWAGRLYAGLQKD
jgi:peptidoglycan/xylan/chitin deacetylase (PgdA/CDA1 family)